MLRNLAVILLVFLSPTVAMAAIPGADNPKAYTEHDYRQQLLEFNHRTIVDAYQQIGHHDPKWDDVVNKFLEAMTVYVTNADADRIYQLPNPQLPIDQLESMAHQIMAARCDDPLVKYLLCRILHDRGDARLVEQILSRTAGPFAKSQCPPYQIAQAIRMAMRALPNDAKTYQPMLINADVATLKSDWKGPIDRRIVLSAVQMDFAYLDADKQGELYNTAKNSHCDEWMTDMIGGKYHIAAGWKARGIGMGNTVTEQGAQTFDKEFAAAGDCFQAAYKLQPTYPEAPDDMIEVAMGLGQVADLRGWFNKTVQAQLDYTDAYTKYLFAIYPRWFGNHEMMFAFGKECAATNRYDTRIPGELVTVLNEIKQDEGGDWEFWLRSGVFQDVRDVLEKYTEQGKDTTDKPFYESKCAGLAWQLHRWDDARQALDKIDGKADVDGMADAGAITDRTTSCIYAMTGTLKDSLTKAEDAAANGQIDSAIAAYDAAKTSAKPDDRGAAWIIGRDQELKWQKQFDAGGWVNLIPANDDFSGWWYRTGSLHANGQQITGETSDGKVSALCGNPFGANWEMQVTFQILPPTNGNQISKNAELGAMWCWTPLTKGYALYLRPKDGSAIWCESYLDPAYIPGFWQHQPTTVTIRLRDGKGDLLSNGRPWFTNRTMWEAAYPDGRIGIMGDSPSPGAKFVISEMKIHKLTGASTQPSTDPAGL